MTPERWRRIEELYHAALAQAEGDRAAYLAEACAGDEALLREVSSLLNHLTAGFLATPALALGGQTITHLPAPIVTGSRLGVYEVHEPIGAGGMGMVYG